MAHHQGAIAQREPKDLGAGGEGREQREEPAVNGGRLDHRGHLCPAAQQARRRHQQQRSIAGDDGAPAGKHALLLDQVLQAPGRDDPRQGPAGKGHGPVMGAGTEDEAARRQSARSARSGISDDAVIAQRPDRGLRHVVDGGMADDPKQRLGPRLVLVEDRRRLAAELARDLPEILAAGLPVVVDQGHLGPAGDGLGRGRKTGRSGADDGDLGRSHGAVARWPAPSRRAGSKASMGRSVRPSRMSCARSRPWARPR